MPVSYTHLDVYKRQAISTLNRLLWDKQIAEEPETRIFKTIGRSIMTYGSEVWTANKSQEQN